jgi:4-hydroxybenzoate polyprenyltransferase
MMAVLGATVVIYNMNMLSGLEDLRTSGTGSVRHRWVMANEDALMVYLGVGSLLSLAFFLLHVSSWWLLVPAALVALFYVLPLSGGKRLREVGLWKIFLIGGVWGVVTVGLPAMQLKVVPSMAELLLLLSERALFVIAITIPFDVRDLSTDAHKGVRTLPSVLGWKRALALAVGLLALSTWLAAGRLGMEVMLGYMPGTLAALGLIICTRPSRPDMYYSFWLDGTLVLLPLGTAILLLVQP